jgi:Putative papain-like cysteine peptidase (DUF1796)
VRKISFNLQYKNPERISLSLNSLENRFAGFMLKSNLTIMGESKVCYVVKDQEYSCYSFHDFEIKDNPERQLHTFPLFYQKLTRRTDRFYQMMKQSSPLLFGKQM